MKNGKRVNWLNVVFLIILPIIGVLGTAWLVYRNEIYAYTLLFSWILLIIGGLSITVGYHRLYTHQSFRAHWIVRFLVLLISAVAFEGSVLEWASDHRNHHQYTDTKRDPYDITKGFWHAHIYWLFTMDPSKRDFSNVADLFHDPLVKFQHRYYNLIALIVGFFIPLGITSLWGDFWGGVFIAGIMRISLVQHITFCVNSVCHTFGNQPYTDKHSAKDNWLTALFTLGEGYHNFHHKFSDDYRNGIRFYHYDPTKWLIRTLAFVGLASDLKSATKEEIEEVKLKQAQKLHMARTERL